MKKFKTLFLITLIIDFLGLIPLALLKFMPEFMEVEVLSQFPGINEAGENALLGLFDVFGVIAISMVIAVAVAINLKTKETAQSAALILLIIHVGWTLMDWINFVSGEAHPPVPVLFLSLVPILTLGYAWKKGEV